jgi:hypothetical protein
VIRVRFRADKSIPAQVAQTLHNLALLYRNTGGGEQGGEQCRPSPLQYMQSRAEQYRAIQVLPSPAAMQVEESRAEERKAAAAWSGEEEGRRRGPCVRSMGHACDASTGQERYWSCVVPRGEG